MNMCFMKSGMLLLGPYFPHRFCHVPPSLARCIRLVDDFERRACLFSGPGTVSEGGWAGRHHIDPISARFVGRNEMEVLVPQGSASRGGATATRAAHLVRGRRRTSRALIIGWLLPGDFRSV